MKLTLKPLVLSPLVTITVVTVALFTVGSLKAGQIIFAKSDAKNTGTVAQLQSAQQQSHSSRRTTVAAKTKASDPISSSQTVNPPANNPKTATGQTKYSTSSDPRSTAYSLTPPAPNPASFEIAITHNGQVAAGTVISYNATKGERAIYGGDLSTDTPYVTVSRSSSIYSNPYITFTVPDGQTVGLPSKWYADTQSISIGSDSNDYKSSGTSFKMRVDVYGSLPNGNYTIRVHTSRTAQTADAYYYDYFLPVTVID